MDSLLQWLGTQGTPEDKRWLDDLENRYIKLRAKETAIDTGFDLLTRDRSEDDLKRELLALQVAQKKELMGIPVDEDAYDRLIDQKTETIPSGATYAAAGKSFSAIKAPNYFSKPKSGKTDVSKALKGILGIGALSYGTSPRGALKYFGKRATRK